MGKRKRPTKPGRGAKTPPPATPVTPPKPDRSQIDQLVIHYGIDLYCREKPPKSNSEENDRAVWVANQLRELFPTDTARWDLTTEDGRTKVANQIRRWYSDARGAGKVYYQAPPHVEYVEPLQAAGNLTSVVVVPSARVETVANRAGDVLYEIIKQHHAEAVEGGMPADRTEIHIGFAGGRTPSLTAKALAAHLAGVGVATECPNKIVFHSLVGTLYNGGVGVDPNSYAIHFADLPLDISGRVEFRSFPAPGVCHQEHRAAVESNPIVRAARQFARMNLNVIVASCGHSGEDGIDHKSFWNHIGKDCELAGATPKGTVEDPETLEKHWEETKKRIAAGPKILGDFAWFPVTEKGVADPQNYDPKERVPGDPLPVWMTTQLTYDELVAFADPKKPQEMKGKVLLLVAPCGGEKCTKSKGELLKAILCNPRPLVTHVVVDFLSAQKCAEQIKKNGADTPEQAQKKLKQAEEKRERAITALTKAEGEVKKVKDAIKKAEEAKNKKDQETA